MTIKTTVRDVLTRVLCLALAMTMIPFYPGSGRAASDETVFEEIQLLKGDMANIPAKQLSRVSITDPNIADISDAKPEVVTLMGKTPGQTILFLWDESGKRTIVVHVVDEDLSMVRARVEGLLERAKIKGVEITESLSEGKVVLSGSLPEDTLEEFRKTIGPFGDKVLDMVKKEEIQDLVQIDMQITELSTTLTKVMGINWALGANGGIQLPLTETNFPQTTGKVADIFKIGEFNRTTAIVATVNALITEGKGRILSKPRLVVKSGKAATFLVGGEIPITSSTVVTGGASTQNVSYKAYGVSLSVTPTIKEGKVDVELSVQINDIDGSAQSGNDTAFLTRSAQTNLRLDDKQTIVLAGLIKKNKGYQYSRFPLLGSIPILGALFRSTSEVPNSDSEVVISVTPTIIKASKTEDQAQAKEEPSADVASESLPGYGPVQSTPEPRDTAGIPPIVKNSATVPVTVPKEMAPYAQAVQEKISSAIAYPYEAQKNRWQGTVKLALVIKKDGSLRDVFVKESSGYDVFDQDALNTAQILAPYAPFPSNIEQDELSLTIPIVYSLDSFLKSVAKRN